MDSVFKKLVEKYYDKVDLPKDVLDFEFLAGLLYKLRREKEKKSLGEVVRTRAELVGLLENTSSVVKLTFLDFLEEMQELYKHNYFASTSKIWNYRINTISIDSFKLDTFYELRYPSGTLIGSVHLLLDVMVNFTIVRGYSTNEDDLTIENISHNLDWLQENATLLEVQPKFQGYQEIYLKNQNSSSVFKDPKVYYINTKDSTLIESGYFYNSRDLIFVPNLIPEFQLTQYHDFLDIVSNFQNIYSQKLIFSLTLSENITEATDYYRDVTTLTTYDFAKKGNIIYPLNEASRDYIAKNISFEYIVPENAKLISTNSNKEYSNFTLKSYSGSDYLFYNEKADYLSENPSEMFWGKETWVLKERIIYGDFEVIYPQKESEPIPLPTPKSTEDALFKVDEKFIIVGGNNPTSKEFQIYNVFAIAPETNRVMAFYYPDNDPNNQRVDIVLGTIEFVNGEIKKGNYLLESYANTLNKDFQNFYIKSEADYIQKYGNDWKIWASKGIEEFFGRKVLELISFNDMIEMLYSYELIKTQTFLTTKFIDRLDFIYLKSQSDSKDPKEEELLINTGDYFIDTEAFTGSPFENERQRQTVFKVKNIDYFYDSSEREKVKITWGIYLVSEKDNPFKELQEDFIETDVHGFNSEILNGSIIVKGNPIADVYNKFRTPTYDELKKVDKSGELSDILKANNVENIPLRMVLTSEQIETILFELNSLQIGTASGFFINSSMIVYTDSKSKQNPTQDGCDVNTEDIMKGQVVKRFYIANKERFEKINQKVSCNLLKALVSLSNYEVCRQLKPISSEIKREPTLIVDSSSASDGIKPKKDLLSKIKNLKKQ